MSDPTNWSARLALAAAIVAAAVLVALAVRAVRGRYAIDNTTPFVSAIDGMAYRVHERHTAPQRAADTLAAINARVIALLRHLRWRYVRSGSAGPRARAAARLLARYNPDNLAENSPRDPGGDTSYTVDKGAIVALCLRGRESYGIHDIDTLTFVTLHEMAHIAIEDIDHPPRFWSVFRFLLEEAEAADVYTSRNFASSPVTYCGLRIDYNPRYDPGVPLP